MRNRLLVACGYCFIASTANAAPVNPNAPSEYWGKTPSSARFAYAKLAAAMAYDVCPSGKCGSVEIKACMDEAVRPPMPKAIANMTIGEVAVGCISTLR